MQILFTEKEEKEHQIFGNVCNLLSNFSHCESKKVGAMAVRNHRIIATGVNGTAPGQANCNDYWKEYHRLNCFEISYDKWIKTPEWRELHHKWSLIHEYHAEQNLITEVAKSSASLENCEIYVSLEPCLDCTKLLLALNPKVVYYLKEYDIVNNEERKEKLKMYEKANAGLIHIKLTTN
jgi:dCMP deaminase